MAEWKTPKTNWGQAGQTVPRVEDFNRIEGNTEYLKEQVDNKVDKTSISTVMPISSDAASNERVLGEKVVYDEFALKANDNAVVKLTTDQTIAGVKTFSSSPIVPNATANNEAVNKGQMDAALALKAPLANPTFTGTVTVPTPSVGGAAANKDYVDTAIGNIGSVLDALNGEVI